MKRTLVLTKEGSHTVYCDDSGETFHSKYGALQESQHVFIRHGLQFVNKNFEELSILEIGFGTGLNALLTLIEAQQISKPVTYKTVEAFPLSLDLVRSINYFSFVEQQYFDDFEAMHRSVSGEKLILSNFEFTRLDSDIRELHFEADQFNLVYFDAFSIKRQPWMWETAIFRKLFLAMKSGGILVTYAARSSIKKALRDAGFEVEKLPGAEGKWEMMRARKINDEC